MFSFFEPITVISRQKNGPFRHVGLLLPNGLVAHCSRFCGEHISTVEDFADGHDVIIERVVPLAEQFHVLARIQGAMLAPKEYDAVTNNCEIFVNRMLGAPPASPQLRATVALICLGLAVMSAP